MSQPYHPRYTRPPVVPPPWTVHPRACGGCGTKSLTERGLGPCARCGWCKPAAERAELAKVLGLEGRLAQRLDREAA